MNKRLATYSLSYTGLIPFVSLTLVIMVSDIYAQLAHHLLLSYAAVIASFMGAIHWGIALNNDRGNNHYQQMLSVVPAL